MNPKWLVLSDEDFGHSVDLWRTDLYDSEAEADFSAEQIIKGGSRMVYVFRLDSVYVPQDSRFVEVRQVELVSSKHGGSGGD